MANRRAAQTSPTAPAVAAAAEAEDLPDYCARPTCRQPFTRSGGRGRRQAYCSEICRRAAERELRQTRARLEHFEHVVAQLRTDIASFGSSSPDSPADTGTPDPSAAAEAVARTGGILAFLENSTDPLAQELRALHDAVRPVITANRSATHTQAVSQ